MFDDDEYGLAMFRNPTKIMNEVITEHQSRLNGEKIVADPHNSYTSLLEFSSTMTAESILRMEQVLNGIYEKRAQSTEDLYKHMSDFDYVGMYSSPAPITMTLSLDKNYIINNSVQYNSNYNKIVIPKETVITVGKYEFGLYYPIEIQINRTTNSISIIHDTTENNPLYVLEYNNITAVESSIKSLQLISFPIEAYQFSRQITTETIVKDYGFSKTYDYKNKFYAIRAFNYKDGEYTEFNYCLSENIYDVDTPTIKLLIYPENNQIKVSVPQIYFSKGLIGNKIEIVLYTTYGELDVDISEISSNNINANFAFDSRNITEYSNILNSIPTIIFTTENTKIVGGSNGYTYEELREYIINDTLHETVPVTPIELKSFFSKRGLKISKQVDNITDRVYFAYKTLTDSEGSIIPVTNSSIKITNNSPDDTSTIISNIDGSITILPTTIFKVENITNIYLPLTDTEVSVLTSKSPDNFIDDINNNRYTRTPYHIRLITDERYPRAESYNLLNPTCTNLRFLKDNVTMSEQMTVTSLAITHREEGANGYLLRFGVVKQTDFKTIDENDLLIYIVTNNTTNSIIGKKATYVTDSNDISVYEIELTTDYHINSNNELCITSLVTNDGQVKEQYIALDTTFEIIVGVKQGLFENVVNDGTITKNLPDEYSDFIGVTRQSFLCTFGTILSTTISNNLNINWASEEYELYTEDVYETYVQDVYETNEDGSLVVTIIDDEVQLNKLHSEGDIVLDEDTNPIVKHPAGSIKWVNGEKVLSKDREIQFYIDCMLFDIRLFLSNDIEYENYYKTLTSNIENYLNLVNTTSSHMLERTDVFFRPTNTYGVASFGIGDSTSVTMALALSFHIKFYLYDHVSSNVSVQSIITTEAESIINDELSNDTISIVNISNTIKEELSEYVSSVDVGGINEDISLQTLIITSNDYQPIIGRTLVYNEDDQTYTLEKNITMEFLSVATE